MVQDVDIYEALQYKLLTNAYPHGSRLRAEALREEFGCSSSTIREVLFRLASEGLVVFLEQRGFRVPEQSRVVLHELTHLRILLEGEGVRLSMQNGGVAWEARLSAAHHQLSHIESRLRVAKDTSPLIDIWFAAEREFHDTLIAECGSSILKETHRRIYNRFRQQLMVEDRSFGYLSNNIHQHHDIMEAALSGNAEMAQDRIHVHLSRHLLSGAQVTEPA